MGKTAILAVRIISSADNKGFRKATREIDAFNTRMKRFSDGVKGIGGRLGNFARSVGRVAAPFARFGAVAGSATVAIAGLAAPIAAIGSAAAAAVGPVIALAAGLAPGALGAGVMAIKVLTSAFKGFGTALSATDPAEFAAAIADMSPAAQAAATSLRGIKQEFDQIGQAVQQSFWANVSNIGDLAVLVAPIRAAMTGLAMDMGNATAGLVNFVSQGTGLSAMQQLIANSGNAASSLSYAFASVLQGIIAVGAAASPVLADLSAKLSEMAGGWAERMTAGFADGSLTAYFEQAVVKAQQIGTVLSQLGGIISGVFAAMSAAGQPFLGTLGQLLAATDAWVNSAAGMSTLTSFFSSMSAAVAALLPVVGQVAGIIGGTLAPVIAQLVTTLAPALGQIVGVVGQILSAIAPLAGPIGEIVAMLGSTLAAALSALMPIITQVAGIIGGALNAALAAIAPLMPVIVASFAQLAAGVAPLMPVFASLVDAVVGLIPPAVQLASAVLPGLVGIIVALVPVISAVVQAVAGFVAGLAPLIQLAARLAGPILGALASILGVVASAIAPVVQLAVRLALEFGLAIGVVNRVRGAISAAKGAFDTVRGAISGVVSMVQRLIGALGSIRWPKPPSWLSAIFSAPDDIMTGTPTTGGGMTTAAAGSAGFLRTAASIGPSSTTVVNINIEGAMDPRAVAEQIRSVLRSDSRTRGLATAGAGVRSWQ